MTQSITQSAKMHLAQGHSVQTAYRCIFSREMPHDRKVLMVRSFLKVGYGVHAVLTHVFKI
jgi:hypothetical protein